MVLASLTTVLLGQVFKGQRIILPIEQYQRPPIGIMREIGLGVSAPHSYLRYGLYEHRVVSTAFGDIGRQVVDYVDDRVGDISWEVRRAQPGGKPAWVVEAGGSIRQQIPVPRSREKITWINVAKRWFWLGPDGKILRDNFQFSTPAGAWTMDARFLEDSIEVRLSSPQGDRDFAIHPKDGMDPFHRVFQPMIEGTKTLASQKKFQMIDPVTGAIQHYTASVTGRFSSSTPASPGKGYVVWIKGPFTDHRAYIRDDGELIKVELPNNRWIEGSPVEVVNPGR